MTYNVFGGTLNLTQSNPPFLSIFLLFLSLYSSFRASPSSLSLSWGPHLLKPARGYGEALWAPQRGRIEPGRQMVSVQFEAKKQASGEWWQRCWRSLQTTNFNYKSPGTPKFRGCRTSQPEFLECVDSMINSVAREAKTNRYATVAAPLRARKTTNVFQVECVKRRDSQ